MFLPGSWCQGAGAALPLARSVCGRLRRLSATDFTLSISSCSSLSNESRASRYSLLSFGYRSSLMFASSLKLAFECTLPPNEQAQPRFGRKAKNVGWSALLGLDYTTPSSALWSLLRADGASGSSHRRVQCHGGANERLQRLFINLVALMEIDGTPGVAFEAGVEEA